MKKINFLTIAILLWSLTALGQQEERSLNEFNRVSVSQAIKVYLEQGNQNKAVVEAENVSLEDVITEVSGNRLQIRLDKRNIYRNPEVTVILTYRSLEGIEVNSTAEVKTRNTIKSDILDISVSSAGDGEIEVDVKEIEIEVSGAGRLHVNGKAAEQKTSVSSAGNYDGSDLESERVIVAASSAGSAEVHAKSELEAEASSAGKIRYSGNPDKEFVNSSSGGSVRKN